MTPDNDGYFEITVVTRKDRAARPFIVKKSPTTSEEYRQHLISRGFDGEIYVGWSKEIKERHGPPRKPRVWFFYKSKTGEYRVMTPAQNSANR